MSRLVATSTITAVVVALLLGVGVAVAQTTSAGGMAALKPEMTQQAQRDCLFPSGGWAIVDCSNAAVAYSAALNQYSRYIVQCGVDTRIAWGTAASGQDADSSDGYIPAGTMLPFMTDSSVRYYSCLNIGSDSDCRHIECK